MDASRALALCLLALLGTSLVARGGTVDPWTAAVQLAVAFLGILAACRRNLSIPRGALPVALVWIALAFAAPLWSPDRDAALDAGGALAAAALAFLVACSALRARDRRAVLVGVVALGVVLAVVALVGAAAGRPAGHPFGNPNHLAGFLLVPGALALAALLATGDPSHRTKGRRVVAAGALGVVSIAVAASGSRGAIAAAGLGALLTIGLRVLPRRRAAVLVVGTFSALALGVVLAPAVSPDLLPMARGGNESSAGIRWAIYAASARAALEAAPFGAGPGGFAAAFAPHRPPGLPYVPRFAHDEMLHGLVVLGLPFVLALAVTARLAWRRFASGADGAVGPLTLGCGAAALAVAAHSLVDFPLHVPAIAVAVAILLGIAWRDGQEAVAGARPRRAALAAASVALALVAGTRAVADRAGAESDAAFAAGDFSEAENALAVGLRARPARAPLLARRARAARHDWELGGGGAMALERALRAGEQAHVASPLRADLALDLAELRTLAGDHAGALASAERAAARDPMSPAGHLARARTLARLSHGVDAASAVRDAVLLDARLAESAVAALVRATGDPSLARLALPEDPVALAGAGRALRDAGHPREAAQSFARLLALRPDDLRAALETARSLRAAGERAGAIAVLSRAWARAPGDARIVREFGRLGVEPADRARSAS